MLKIFREVYLEPSRTSTMDLFAKIVTGFQSLTIFPKLLHRKYSTGFLIRLWIHVNTCLYFYYLKFLNKSNLLAKVYQIFVYFYHFLHLKTFGESNKTLEKKLELEKKPLKDCSNKVVVRGTIKFIFVSMYLFIVCMIFHKKSFSNLVSNFQLLFPIFIQCN